MATGSDAPGRRAARIGWYAAAVDRRDRRPGAGTRDHRRLDQAEGVESGPEVFFVPPCVGPSGWVGLCLDHGLDREIVAGVPESGYRLVAPKSAVATPDRGQATRG